MAYGLTTGYGQSPMREAHRVLEVADPILISLKSWAMTGPSALMRPSQTSSSSTYIMSVDISLVNEATCLGKLANVCDNVYESLVAQVCKTFQGD